MNMFIFKSYSFNKLSLTASFKYASAEPEFEFTETVQFSLDDLVSYDEQQLDAALRLAFYLIGTSYFKAFPSPNVKFEVAKPDQFQLSFLASVYQDGLSQFMFENGINPSQMPFSEVTKLNSNTFEDIGNSSKSGSKLDTSRILALQSGGKDSLLTSYLLYKSGNNFTPWNMPYGDKYPDILNSFKKPLRTIKRTFDIPKLKLAAASGAKNGHTPVTYITASLAMIDAILHGENYVVLSIGQEGQEPHELIGDMAVNHQWSKTYQAELLIRGYIDKYISKNMVVGSPLRKYSELKIAKLFIENCWDIYGHSFSSCNRANYLQGANNTKLKWCGTCPKCANSFLLFAPFIELDELISVFGSNLIKNPDLSETFKGLLDIDEVMKPFECVGEVDELRLAYHMANTKNGNNFELGFSVPKSNFNINRQAGYDKRFDAILNPE